MAKIFLDTNILVYLLNNRNKIKQEKCRYIVRTIAQSNEAVISTQVLQEFYVATTAKLKIDSQLIKSIIYTFKNMETIQIGTDLIYEAIDTSIQNKISFWDSLVIVSAEFANCAILYSEDLNDNQAIRNVKIVNPLK